MRVGGRVYQAIQYFALKQEEVRGDDGVYGEIVGWEGC